MKPKDITGLNKSEEKLNEIKKIVERKKESFVQDQGHIEETQTNIKIVGPNKLFQAPKKKLPFYDSKRNKLCPPRPSFTTKVYNRTFLVIIEKESENEEYPTKKITYSCKVYQVKKE